MSLNNYSHAKGDIESIDSMYKNSLRNTIQYNSKKKAVLTNDDVSRARNELQNIDDQNLSVPFENNSHVNMVIHVPEFSRMTGKKRMVIRSFQQ